MRAKYSYLKLGKIMFGGLTIALIAVSAVLWTGRPSSSQETFRDSFIDLGARLKQRAEEARRDEEDAPGRDLFKVGSVWLDRNDSCAAMTGLFFLSSGRFGFVFPSYKNGPTPGLEGTRSIIDGDEKRWSSVIFSKDCAYRISVEKLVKREDGTYWAAKVGWQYKPD